MVQKWLRKISLQDVKEIHQCGDITVYWIDDTEKIYLLEYPDIYWDNISFTYRFGDITFNTWGEVEDFMKHKKVASEDSYDCC